MVRSIRNNQSDPRSFGLFFLFCLLYSILAKQDVALDVGRNEERWPVTRDTKARPRTAIGWRKSSENSGYRDEERTRNSFHGFNRASRNRAWVVLFKLLPLPLLLLLLRTPFLLRLRYLFRYKLEEKSRDVEVGGLDRYRRATCTLRGTIEGGEEDSSLW